jgi:hypothetical protein
MMKGRGSHSNEDDDNVLLDYDVGMYIVSKSKETSSS